MAKFNNAKPVTFAPTFPCDSDGKESVCNMGDLDLTPI